VELHEVATAVGAHGEVAGVLAAEPAPGTRAYLVALGHGEGRRWLAVDERARPLLERAAVRAVASLVAMCEIAADAAGEPDEARVASAAYLDAVGSSGLVLATGVVEAFVAEVEERYLLALR
jgi:hypothetical protein